MSGKKIIFGPVNVVCGSCEGTGLYQGFAEKDSCAVICDNCNGTGCVEVKHVYEEFTKCKPAKGITRVFATSCGYIQSAKDVTTDEGITIEFSKGGCTYEEFVNGVKPKPVKDLYCPYAWTGQRMQSSGHEDYKFYEKHCEPVRNIGGYISDCPKYRDKAICWKLYEEMQQKI